MLVGGSTRDPYLAEMVSEVKKPEPVTYNPDEIVAQGAAWFAYLKYLGKANSVVSDITKALGIELLSGGVRSLIPPNSKIPITSKVLLRNSMDTDILTLNLLQGDSLTASKNTRIGQLIFHYAKPVKANRGMVCVSINISADGIIALKARESLSDEEVVRIESS
ncbi:MAG: Hsp70 family protein [Firmicutes bacterium]|nr:Hsp70 family protein [Bacillota bacterium]